MFVGVAGTISRASILALDEGGSYVMHFTTEHGFVWNLATLSERINYLTYLIDELAHRVMPGKHAVHLRTNIDRITLGLAGIDWRYTQSFDHVVAYLGLAGRTVLSCIGQAAMHGALLKRPGILVRAGAGSTVYGTNRVGTTHMTNAWDRVVGDQGSAFQIARDLLTIAARQTDERLQSKEADEIALELARAENCANFTKLHEKLTEVQELQGRTEYVRVIGSLSKAAFSLAAKGNLLAIKIIERACDDLVEGVAAVSTKLGLPSEDPVPLVYDGGVLLHEPYYRQALTARLEKLQTQLRMSFDIRPGRFAAVVGAALIAATGSAIEPPVPMLNRLESTLPPASAAPELYCWQAAGTQSPAPNLEYTDA